MVEFCITGTEIITIILAEPDNARIVYSNEDFIVIKSLITDFMTTWLFNDITELYCQYPSIEPIKPVRPGK